MAERADPVELHHLSYFIAAADHGSFRKAAAALGISQSAISRRIRDLEDRVGVSLFHRHRCGVALTIAGASFLQRVRVGLDTINEGVLGIASFGRGEQGIVRIGISAALASAVPTTLLRRYSRDHPAVRMEFVRADMADPHIAILQGRCDPAFVADARQSAGCDVLHLWSERIFAVLPRDHRLIDKEELAWSDLMSETFIVDDAAPGRALVDLLTRRFAEVGSSASIRQHRIGRDGLLSLIALRCGLALATDASRADRLPCITYRPIGGESLHFAAIWSPRNDNPALRRLLSIARAMARQPLDDAG